MHPLCLITEKKLDARARACVYLGHKTGVKGFILYDTHTREVFVSRNIVFRENLFPFHSTSTTNSNSGSIPTCSSGFFANADIALTPFDADIYPPPPPPIDHNNNLEPASNFTFDQLNPAPSSHPVPSPTNNQPLRRPTRTRQPLSYLQDFHCNLASFSANPSSL